MSGTLSPPARVPSCPSTIYAPTCPGAAYVRDRDFAEIGLIIGDGGNGATLRSELPVHGNITVDFSAILFDRETVAMSISSLQDLAKAAKRQKKLETEVENYRGPTTIRLPAGQTLTEWLASHPGEFSPLAC